MFVDIMNISVFNVSYILVTLLHVKRLLNYGFFHLFFLTYCHFRHVIIQAIKDEHYHAMALREHGGYIKKIGGD